ncbi:heavy metal translocating P-type ATPase [Dehalobacterium formicoaceticum]|uniref:Cd(2+)-exporting ATPase n=1 Tax=Dehalobacterium formicoaceticum TaxID=51515 RepID=A0ABT1Y6L9_9FIRM|nr:cation-translocating P-type ATPase [Dehalobacterium formicoaceticum]MCR6546532.1 cation-translocating P-type ATPase [Dehalobacterium formicoaceticum]
MKRLNDFFAGLPMTIAGGVFLVASLILMLMKIEVPVDPAWVSVIICGIPLLYLAIWRVICNKGINKISSALLISIAMIAAIAIGDIFAAGEVAFIMAIGAILEDKTSERSKKGLKELISLAPQQGRRINNGKEEMINAEAIKVGYILRVLPGEIIPVDGKIISGNTSVDQAIMTGESLPVDKEVGDSVFCGTINRFGAIDMEATNVGEDSSLQKLIRMVQDAENKQAPIQRIADKWATRLVPVALLIAIVTYFVTQDIVRGVTVLVVFCPCALVLATPTAIMAAIGQATKHGVIIKSGEALEKMGKVDTIAFDKTGTLTFGKLEVSDTISFTQELDENELLALIASAESRSEHPLGKAIVLHAKVKNLVLKETSGFRMEAGKGIYANVSGCKLLCGSEKYLIENGIDITKQVCDTLDTLRNQGKASLLAAADGICVGVVGLSDVLRPTANEMVAELGEMGTQTVLLTGDNRRTADYFAKQAGITSVRAELLPEEKLENIVQLQQEGKSVCMIGDGVNDAPALKTASVGVAMGAMGSDIAVDAADIALMSDDISKIPYLKRLSNATVRTIKFSIALSLFINFVAILMSFMGWLTPTTGALVHNAGSILVVLIAALLYDRKFGDKGTGSAPRRGASYSGWESH